MTWKNLGNPKPRAEPGHYTPLAWDEGWLLPFASSRANDGQQHEGSPNGDLPFNALIGSRRTRYGLHAVGIAALGELFSLTCRISLDGPSPLGFALSKRPAPSAGAIHPVHVVIHLPGQAQLHRYDPYDHGLRPLNCPVDPVQLRSAMNEVVHGGDAVLLLFVAEPAKTFAKYENGCSLVWRDAGILQGYFSLAAESLALNLVPLGVTGDPWAGELVKQSGLVGVGAAFVGARA